MITLPKEGGLADRNRAQRRIRLPESPRDRAFTKAFRGIVSKPERLALSTIVAAYARAHEGEVARTTAHPQARKIARLGRQMEASLIARELYPVIDRARGLPPRP